MSYTVSPAITAERKHVRNDLATCDLIWGMVNPRDTNLADDTYIGLVRKAHFLRMMAVPRTFPDGRRLPKVAQGHLTPKKRTEGKGKRRRPL